MTKSCTICAKVLPLTDFYKHDRNPSGYTSACKECDRLKRIKPKYHYLYLIEHPLYPGWVKLGRTVDLKHRLETYNVGTPLREMKYAYTAHVYDVGWIERAFNATVESNGHEWFKISVEQAVHKIEALLQARVVN